MRPLRDIKRLVSHAHVRSTPEANRAVLNGLLRELAACKADASVPAGRRVWTGPVTGAIAAAALVMIVTMVVISHTSREPTRQPPHVEASSVAEMLTVGRLNTACRRGGLPEVERQCEQAAQKLQSRPERISMEQLIREMKGT